jgi:hypothetical protein
LDKSASLLGNAFPRRSTSSLDPVNRAVLILLLGVTLASPALGADTVAIGKGISNSFASDLTCEGETICLDSLYMWIFDATRTVSGPTVKGRTKALIAQHVDATPQFVKSVELFVLRPIEDVKLRRSSGANYYLLSVSPRYADDMYCVSVDPEDLGLNLPKLEVTREAEGGHFCFKRKLLGL